MMSLPLSVLGVNAATLLNAFALLAACPGAWLLSITRLREQRALAHLAALSEERAVDQPMLFLDIRTLRAQRFAYRLGFACLGLALIASWFSTRL
ncbi:hypothetical protein HZF02_25935 [Pseudomonas yamanorum]|nr:hypothetical protein HZF02_25935 [Pseudomonas yamanorum]